MTSLDKASLVHTDYHFRFFWDIYLDSNCAKKITMVTDFLPKDLIRRT